MTDLPHLLHLSQITTWKYIPGTKAPVLQLPHQSKQHQPCFNRLTKPLCRISFSAKTKTSKNIIEHVGWTLWSPRGSCMLSALPWRQTWTGNKKLMRAFWFWKVFFLPNHDIDSVDTGESLLMHRLFIIFCIFIPNIGFSSMRLSSVAHAQIKGQ